MNLWEALGVSPQTGLLAAAAGLLAAVVLALANFHRGAREESTPGLGLDDR